MQRTVELGAITLIAALFLLVGYVVGVRYANSQRPQPCIRTYTADGHRFCQLDPSDGAWVT